MQVFTKGVGFTTQVFTMQVFTKGVGFTVGAQLSNNSDTCNLDYVVSFIIPGIETHDNETRSVYNFSTSDEINTTGGRLAVSVCK